MMVGVSDGTEAFGNIIYQLLRERVDSELTIKSDVKVLLAVFQVSLTLVPSTFHQRIMTLFCQDEEHTVMVNCARS